MGSSFSENRSSGSRGSETPAVRYNVRVYQSAEPEETEYVYSSSCDWDEACGRAAAISALGFERVEVVKHAWPALPIVVVQYRRGKKKTLAVREAVEADSETRLKASAVASGFPESEAQSCVRASKGRVAS